MNITFLEILGIAIAWICIVYVTGVAWRGFRL